MKLNRIVMWRFSRRSYLFLGPRTVRIIEWNRCRAQRIYFHDSEIEEILWNDGSLSKLSFPSVKIILNNRGIVSIDFLCMSRDNRISVVQWLYEKALFSKKDEARKFLVDNHIFFDPIDNSLQRKKYLLKQRIIAFLFLMLFFVHCQITEIVFSSLPFSRASNSYSAMCSSRFALFSILTIVLRRNGFWGNRWCNRYYKNHAFCDLNEFWFKLLFSMGISIFLLFVALANNTCLWIVVVTCSLSVLTSIACLYLFVFSMFRVLYVFASLPKSVAITLVQ